MPNNPDNTCRCSTSRKIRSALLLGAGLIFSALSLSAQTPPAGPDSAMITATVDIAVENQIPLWSYQNKVMIDFSGIEPTEALIHILDISGRSVITEKVKSGSMYTREISNIAASYILVEIAVGHRRFSRLLYLTEPQS